MKKPAKYIAAVIAAAVMLSAMPFSALAEDSADAAADEIVAGVEDNESSSDENDNGENTSGENDNDNEDDGPTFSGGDGSEVSPYLISSAADLKALAEAVNNGNSYAGKYFKLTAGIDTSSVLAEGELWAPIGKDSSAPFSGTFDGSNLKINNKIQYGSGFDYRGLFGYVGESGTVKNLTVTDYVGGKEYVGGIVGYNAGTISNCTNTGAVEGTVKRVGGIAGYNEGRIENCKNSGIIGKKDAPKPGTGGIAGENKGTITGCENSGAVIGTSDVGGIVGNNNSTVQTCYNTGDVTGNENVGGVTGSENSNTTENCYNIGKVTGITNVGGVVGYVSGSGKVQYCYSIGETNGGGAVGSSSGTITSCFYLADTDKVTGNDTSGAIGYSADDLKNEDTFKDWISASGGEWEIVRDTESGLIRPVFRNSTESGIAHIEQVWSGSFKGAGTEASPYIIHDLKDLEKLRDLVNAGNTGYDKHFKLETDIDMSSIRNWEPIGVYVLNDLPHSKPFSGTFDGNEKKIRNLQINVPNSRGNGYGLFGYNAGTVKKLGIIDGYVKVASNTEGYGNEVGAVAGYNIGEIVYCYNYGCNVSGRDRVGGIVGSNAAVSDTVKGTVQICFNTGDVNASNASAGGIAGDNGGIVENCYNTGDIKAKEWVGGVVGYNSVKKYAAGVIENAYNYGNVTGESDVGGVVGFFQVGTDEDKIGTVHKCFFREGTSSFGIGNKGTNDNAESLSKERFEDQSIFEDAGWNFNGIWIMSETLKRPIFGINKEVEVAPPVNSGSGTESDTDSDEPATDPDPDGSWQNPGWYPFFPASKDDTSSADADDDVSSGAGSYENSEMMNGLSYAGIGIVLISAAGALAVILRKRTKSSK